MCLLLFLTLLVKDYCFITQCYAIGDTFVDVDQSDEAPASGHCGEGHHSQERERTQTSTNLGRSYTILQNL